MNPAETFDLLTYHQRTTGDGGRRVGQEWLFQCPGTNHQDRNPSFSIGFRGGRYVWNCRSRCGGGDSASYMVLIGQATDEGDGLRVLAAMAGEYRPVMAAHPLRPIWERTQPLPEPDRPDNAGETVEKFVYSRGWTRAVIDRFQLTAVVDRYDRVRVRFPFIDHLGQTIAAQDRAVGNCKYRWISEGSVPFPFNLHGNREILERLTCGEFENGDDIFLCEGLTDTVALADRLPDICVVGLPGGTIKSGWERYFKDVNVFVCFDSDDPGVAKRAEIHRRLAGKAANVYDVHVPSPYCDVDEWQGHTVDFTHQFVNAVSEGIQ